MGLLQSLPVTAVASRDRLQQHLSRWQAGQRWPDEDEKEDGLCEVVVIGGGGEKGEPAAEAETPAEATSMQQQQQRANPAGDRSMSPMYLPEVDTDDAVKIWCSRSQPSQPTTQGGPSVWLAAEQERSSSSGSDYELDEEEDEEEEEEEGTTTGGSTESTTTSSSSSTSTIPSGMLRQWRRIRKCYADNPDVIGEIHVYRVLTYMGHPHWRKCYGASPAGDSPNLTTVLQTTMALRLEDLRQKKLQMEAAWRTMKKGGRPISRVVLEAKRHAVQQLEKELMSLHEESAKVSRKTRSAKRAEVATGETASAAHDVH
ncbi:uncharacterized protein LOC144123556 [Amblyomma americanum]